MATTIQQSVTFNASPEALYDIYMDSKKHAAAVGSKASVSRNANVPDHDQAGIKSGWHKYYWTPWKAYLRKKKSGRR